MCGLSALTYIFVQIAWVIDSAISKLPFCNAEPYGSWIYFVKGIESALFFGHGAVFLTYIGFVRNIDKEHNNFIAECVVTVTVDLIAGTASLTFAVLGLGGVCEDVFG